MNKSVDNETFTMYSMVINKKGKQNNLKLSVDFMTSKVYNIIINK